MNDLPSQLTLPDIPSKRYFSTSEVASLCQLKPHVLRYWEKEFPSLQPTRKKGGQRYYQYNDVILVCYIQYLVHEQNYSLSYAKRYIRQYGKTNIVQQVLAHQQPSPNSTGGDKAKSTRQHSNHKIQDSKSQQPQNECHREASELLESIKQDLQSLLKQLNND